MVLAKLTNAVKTVLGTSNDARLKAYRPLLRSVNALEEKLQGEDDSRLKERADSLREQAQKGADLKSLQSEAFALVREAADRRLGMWNAIDGSVDHDDDFWGSALAEVKKIREQLAEGVDRSEIHASSLVYEQIRKHYPISKPPCRMRAHDVQVTGAAVLHDGCIAEMKTGEGKTLVASLACYLNALPGDGVHVVTVNDYLAKRDAAWNTPTFAFLGMRVGAIHSELDPSQRQGIYAADVTYGTNNEFGFDYLRDNLKQRKEEQVQTRRNFAIVDEVDSALIDEARTPLIISGPAANRTETYIKANEVAKGMEPETHFEIDIKDRTVNLTDEGISKAAELFGIENLYDAESMHLPHFLDNSLKAHHIFMRDKDYLVKGGEVVIIDEFTGRAMTGRRWSDGLHQAVEAKEGQRIQEETQTYATITLQNFFRMYSKLSGMTGTAMTEAQEFNDIYRLQTIAVPTNKPVIRRDMPDLIFGTEQEKFNAIIDEVKELHMLGQPVLVGTISVDVSERLSESFKRKGIKHNVLNARQHQREAEIVKDAGQLGGVTIATNMAGRGTDIVLGTVSPKNLLKHWVSNGLAPKKLKVDSPERDEALVDNWVKLYIAEDAREKLKGQALEEKLRHVNKERHINGWADLPNPVEVFADDDAIDLRRIGGLRIIGTERHESRRIDNQLRGRSGRQGDPGSSRFFMSLDDDLMKRFAGERMASLMRNIGLKDGQPIESRMVSNSVEKAQKRVEEVHYGQRKNLLEYDQVMNSQRKEIYAQRQQILEGEDLEVMLLEFLETATDQMVQEAAGDGTRGQELADRLAKEWIELTGLPEVKPEDIPVVNGGDACREFFMERIKEGLQLRRDNMAKELGDSIEDVATREKAITDMYASLLRFVLLETIDRRWKDHLYAMDHLRHAIGLESYGQKDPKMRYKEEGYNLFMQMYQLIRTDIARIFFRLQLQRSPEQAAPVKKKIAEPEQSVPKIPAGVGPGPNDPCPCGSGRKYRECHGVF